jgi:serine/threonine protein kinase
MTENKNKNNLFKNNFNNLFFKSNHIISNRYEVIRRIAKFDETVYLCRDLRNDNKEVVIKAEKIGSKRSSQLENEWILYKKLVFVQYFNNAIDFWNDSNYRYLSLKKFGLNLWKFHRERRALNDWTLDYVCELSLQMIALLELLHNSGVIHRDPKPSNFVYETDESDHLILIDLDLAQEFCDSNGVHIEAKRHVEAVGNPFYMSLNGHNGHQLSRRDDMIFIGYVFIYLAKGRLPWSQLRRNQFGNKLQFLKAIEKEKMRTTYDMLCKDLPKAFLDYFNYCSNLEFDEKPDYQRLKALFIYE